LDLIALTSPESFVDWAIITVCGISGLMGLKGGFIKESVSLFGWILAHFVATVSAEPITIAVGIDLSQDSLLYLFSYGLVFAAVVVFFSTVGAGVSARLQNGHTKLGNSLLGAAFGVCRGVVLLSVLSLLLNAAAPEWHDDIFGHTVYAKYLEITGTLLSSGFESEFFNDPNSFFDQTVDDASDMAEGT
jgi:membrane protein required for colicin V production